MGQILQPVSGSAWILVALVALGLLVLLLAVRALVSVGEVSESAGLPEAPEGLERLSRHDDSELFDAIRSAGARQERYYVTELSTGEPIALGHTPRQPWVDVVVRRRRAGDPEGIHTGPYEVFSFSLSEERWSYGALPPVHREVEEIVRGAFRHYLLSTGRG